MKKFSKLFWVALVVVAVLACTAIGIFAADTTETTNAVVYGDFVDLSQEGDSFEVGFHFKENNTLVECGKITLTWDSNKMTAESIVAADALNGAHFGSKIENGKAVIAWAGSDIKDTVKEGDLFTVTFTKVSADVTDALIDVTVDDFGYTTETYKSVDMAGTVKVNNAFANDGTTVEMPYAEGETNYGDPVAFLNAALERAETGEGQTVNVVLGADIVFDAYTVIGAASSNHVGKVVITSNPASTYGIKLQNNPVVTMYGNYEFSNMLLETVSLSEDNRYDNALVFPDDCSAVFGEGITKTESAKPLNIAGNVTVNSGTYVYIAGNAKGSGVKIEKELNITVQGTTNTQCVVGGMIEGASNGGQVNAKSNVKILGAVNVTDEVIAGARYTYQAGTAGADVLINTTGTINRLTACSLGPCVETSEFNTYILNGTIETLCGMRSNGGASAGKPAAEMGLPVVKDADGNYTEGTVVNIYVDGGTVGSSYLGLYALGNGAVTAKGEVNLYYNHRLTGEDKPAIYGDTTYPEDLGVINYFYGGSRPSDVNLTDDLDKNFYIKQGSFVQFFGGSYIIRDNTVHSGSTNFIIESATFNNGTDPITPYFGSRFYRVNGESGNAYALNCEHSGSINIEIHDFNGFGIYGGSSVYGTDNKHSGTINTIISGGSFAGSIVGGSKLNAGTIQTENATVTLTVQPAPGKAFNMTGASKHLVGGSDVGSGSDHKADSYLILKDVQNRANSTIAQNGNTSLQSRFSSNGVVCGGSLVNNGIHSGDSQLLIQRCRLLESYTFVGGSRMDGNTSVHSGKSKLIIDANTGIKQINGVFQEVEGEGGYFDIYEHANSGLFGGSYLNGSYLIANPNFDSNLEESDSNPKQIQGPTSNAKQTGESSVELIAPANPGANWYERLYLRGATVANGSTGAAVYGGSYYVNNSKNFMPQQHDSYVNIVGNVNISSGFKIYGGSRYNTKAFNDEVSTFVPSSKVIVDGTFPGAVIGGVLAEYDAPNQVYNHNSSVVLKSGGVTGSITLSSVVDYKIKTNFTGGKQKGIALLEIYDDAVADNSHIGLSELGVFGVNGIKGIKLIGKFNDGSDEDSVFTLSTNLTMSTLDITQATGSNLAVYKKAKAADANTTLNCTTLTIERIYDGKYIYFAKADSTLTGTSDTLPATQQVEVNPTMTFAGLLATTGLKIYNTPKAENWNKLHNYSDYTKFDCVSTSPNAFVFYAADADGNKIGEPLTQIPADPSQKIIVQTGTTYSAPTLLRYKCVTVSGTVTTNETEPVTIQLIKKGETEATDTFTSTPAEGSVTYSFESVSIGEYILKVSSNYTGVMPITKEIAVVAEDVAENFILTVFDKSMQASLESKDIIKLYVGYKLKGVTSYDPADEEYLNRFGLLIWNSEVTAEEALYGTQDAVYEGANAAAVNSEGIGTKVETATDGIPAKNMADALWLRAYFINDDGTYSYSKLVSNYCPAKYCINQIKSHKNESAPDTMAALLNYGSAAQIYFNHNTEKLMNSLIDDLLGETSTFKDEAGNTIKSVTITQEMIDEWKTVAWDENLVRIGSAHYTLPTDKCVNFQQDLRLKRGGTVELSGAFSPVFTATIKDEYVSEIEVKNATVYYWTESQIANLDVLTTENAIHTEAATKISDVKYEGVYDGLPARLMFDTIYCSIVFTDANDNTFTTGVAGYSPERLASSRYNSSNVNEANLAKAMIVYGDAARKYFAE